MIRLIRSAFVIARRDFTATVLSKTFLFFLLGPLFPLLFGGVFGGIGAHVASEREKPVVAVVATPAEFAPVSASRNRLAQAIDEDNVVRLALYAPEPGRSAQLKRLLATTRPPVQAVLPDPLRSPHLTGAVDPDGSTVRQLQLILADSEAAPRAPPSVAVTETHATSGSLSKDQAATGQVGQLVLFFLTLLLSTMLLSQLIEEKSNKIIEVIAAAVPIDALFVGKLFAMLAASVIGIIVWISAGALLIQFVKHGGVATLPPPAVGWPSFLVLTIVYFGMNYLLLGAAFLTIGAQASTAREVQTLSMPVTFGQMLLLLL